MQTIHEALASYRYVQDGVEYTYYKDGTRAELKADYLPEGTIDLGGKSYTLAKIDMLSAKLFADELDSKLNRMNPFIYDVFAKYAVNCFDLIRMVNFNSKQGFRGATGSGNELDAIPFMARQFQDPDGAVQTARTSWEKTVLVADVGVDWFFEDFVVGAHGGEQTMGEEEGMIWLAWYNPAQTPCVDAFQITMNTELYNIQSLDFDQFDEYHGDVVIEFKQPWTLPPEQSGKIQAYYFQAGTDEMRPIGLWVKMAKNVRALATLT